MRPTQENDNNNDEPIFSEENRKKLTILIMNLFKLWGLKNEDQLNLLGLSSSSLSALTNYRKGKALPAKRDLLDRVGWLMAIHSALSLLYPDKSNANLKYRWINCKNKVFNNLTPLEIMKDEGLVGIARIARYLDNLQDK